MTTTARLPPPRPAYPGPFHPAPPPRRGTSPRSTHNWTVLVILAVIAVLAVRGQQALTGPSNVPDTQTAAPTPVPSPNPFSSPVPDRAGTAGAVEDFLVEGIDYAYLSRVDGQPVRWPCTNDITLALTGPTPIGASSALASTITTLRQATGLPLTQTSPDNPGTSITISYTDDDIEGDPATAGNARTQWTGATIISSDITLRADIDPISDWGITVMTHEISHALGLAHTTEDAPEIMAPAGLPTGQPLGPGDLHALHTIGCRADRQ